MTRRKPLCANCGKPLARSKQATVIHEWTGVKGRPMYGAHFHQDPSKDCTKEVPPAHGDSAAPLSSILRLIAGRGPGRVLMTRGVTLDEACADADRIWSEEPQHGSHTYSSAGPILPPISSRDDV